VWGEGDKAPRTTCGVLDRRGGSQGVAEQSRRKVGGELDQELITNPGALERADGG
jgi:hypothetical protein